MIIAEHKEPLPSTVTDGITLFTTHVRRATPDTLDPKLNAHSKLNDISACIQAYTAGADEALMLDPHGFVATCNSTHFFIVKGTTARGVDVRRPLLPRRHHPRQRAPRLPRRRIAARETTFSLTDVYSRRRRSSPARSPGSCPSLGRRPHDRQRHSRTRGRRLQRLYGELVAADVRSAGTVTVRVAMWSGPRNISTAMMRAWENRPDTVVVDEPFYAAYLARTGSTTPDATR